MGRLELVMEWGPEVVLRCACRDIRAHLMDGRSPRCPVCKTKTELLLGTSWEDIELRNKR